MDLIKIKDVEENFISIKEKILLSVVVPFFIISITLIYPFSTQIQGFDFRFFVIRLISLLIMSLILYGVISLLEKEEFLKKRVWLLGGIASLILIGILSILLIFVEEMLIIMVPILFFISLVIGSLVGLLIQKKLNWLVITIAILYLIFLILSNYYSYMNQSQSTINAIISLAEERQDFKFCNRISNNHQKDLCYDQVYLIKGQADANPEICNKIKNPLKKDECIYHSVIQKGPGESNSIYCEKISNETLKENCQMFVFGKNDPEFVRIALETNCLNNQSAYIYQNDFYRDICIYNLVSGMYKKDIDYCDKISDINIELKDSCKTDEGTNFEVLKKAIEKAMDFCKNYPERFPGDKDSCITSFIDLDSVRKIDGVDKYCELVKSESKRKSCFRMAYD